MSQRSPLVVAVLLLVMASFPISGATIAARTPGDYLDVINLDPPGQYSVAVVASWTQEAATNVSVAAYLSEFVQESGVSFGYQLSTAIGPSAASSDLIGAGTFYADNSPYPTVMLYDLFTGLDLGAGTYYLTLFSTSGTGLWAEYTNAILEGSVGPTYSTYAGTVDTTDPFRSEFIMKEAAPVGFIVTGDPTGVPEPSEFLPFGIALGVLLARKRLIP